MMKNSVLLAGLLLAIFSPAVFAAEGGLYLSVQGGGTFVEGVKNDTNSDSFNFEFDPGWMAGASLGYDFADTYPSLGTGRIEIEVAWRENDLDEIEFAQPSLGASGTASVTSVMLNTIGEFRDAPPWIPYIGVGAGAARLTLDQFAQGPVAFVDDDDTVFAWQILAGLGWQVSPRIVLDLGYRYFSALDPEFTDALGVDFESEYDSHSVVLGARLDF